MVSQHTRRHLVDRMFRSSKEESNLEADHDDLDEDENTSIIRSKAGQDVFYACKLGLLVFLPTIPILQVALKRESSPKAFKGKVFYVSILSPP